MEHRNGTGHVKSEPNQTLFVANLPDKLPKSDLRRALYMAFSTYGPVLDVVALKTMKMRGQAHIVYRDIQTSTQALRALQGLDFFGHEIRLSYAKGKSDIISRLDGTGKTNEIKDSQPSATDLQRSIFHHGGQTATTVPQSKAPGLSADMKVHGAKSPQGVKRRRSDVESDEERGGRINGGGRESNISNEDSASSNDDDDGEAMEESDED